MFKRLRWMATGMAFGLGGSVWAQRKIKAATDRYRPAGVASAAATRAREALDEGREAMRLREAELHGRALPAAAETRPARRGGRRRRSP